jgi:hypothetical protein
MKLRFKALVAVILFSFIFPIFAIAEVPLRGTVEHQFPENSQKAKVFNSLKRAVQKARPKNPKLTGSDKFWKKITEKKGQVSIPLDRRAKRAEKSSMPIFQKLLLGELLQIEADATNDIILLATGKISEKNGSLLNTIGRNLAQRSSDTSSDNCEKSKSCRYGDRVLFAQIINGLEFNKNGNTLVNPNQTVLLARDGRALKALDNLKEEFRTILLGQMAKEEGSLLLRELRRYANIAHDLKKYIVTLLKEISGLKINRTAYQEERLAFQVKVKKLEKLVSDLQLEVEKKKGEINTLTNLNTNLKSINTLLDKANEDLRKSQEKLGNTDTAMETIRYFFMAMITGLVILLVIVLIFWRKAGKKNEPAKKNSLTGNSN